jgi:FkbH-like protein
MFEFDKYRAEQRDVPPLVPHEAYQPVREVYALSLLMWGEHCVECAAPACFSSCDLYSERPDGRCRRFRFGAYRNTAFSSLRGYGAEIAFKQWGKLEARGNTRMLPLRAVFALESLLALVAPPLNALGAGCARLTGDARWRAVAQTLGERIGRWLHRHASRDAQPDAFLVEIYNPDPQPIQVQLGMAVSRTETAPETYRERAAPAFRASIECPHGYSRHEFPARAFEAITTSGLPFDIALVPEAGRVAHLVVLSADFVRHTAKKTGALAVKCVVFDLDHTLWDGVLLEDSGVSLKPGVAELIRTLDARGILMSIASKNNPEDGLQRLEALGIAEYFLHPQIGWLPKSMGIRAIAERLNIGLDTFCFVDDNAFERAEVARMLPEVWCLDVTELPTLAAQPRCQGADTTDARQRRHYYRDALKRDETRSGFGEDYRAFLADCAITLAIAPYGDADLERVAELVQRTNQLNFSGRKYPREALAPLLADTALHKYTLRVRDRFGDYGLVGFCMARTGDGAVHVEDFMLSCRVQNLFIEQAFFAWLARRHAAARLSIHFHPTGRNKPAQQVLESLCFTAHADGGLTLDLLARPLDCYFITVQADEC